MQDKLKVGTHVRQKEDHGVALVLGISPKQQLTVVEPEAEERSHRMANPLV